jgi:hypothetical protein
MGQSQRSTSSGSIGCQEAKAISGCRGEACCKEVVVVIAVVVTIVLVVFLVVALAVYLHRAPDPDIPQDALASLHAIRARTMAARYRRESCRDADRIRRELRHEIHELDKGR